MSNNLEWTSYLSHAFQIERHQIYLHTMICTRYCTWEVLLRVVARSLMLPIELWIWCNRVLLQPIVGRNSCDIKHMFPMLRIACYMIFTHHAHVQWKHDMLVRFEMMSAIWNWEVGISGCESHVIANHSWPIKTWGHVINRSLRSH